MSSTPDTLSLTHDGTRFRQSTRRIVANYLATALFIGISYWIVTRLSGFHRDMLRGEWDLSVLGVNATITTGSLFVTLMVLYAIILPLYYAAYPWIRSSAFIFLQGIWFALRRHRSQRPGLRDGTTFPLAATLSPLAKQSGRALLLKFFFAPLMINWCLIHIANLSGSLLQLTAGFENGLTGRALFDTSIFWASFQLILFIDTLLFTLGYLIELPVLGNRIRSVDPTFFGWFICLACYPPFNDMTMRFLAWQSSDFPYIESDLVHLSVNVTLLTALAVFSWASIALGFKASNLTNRGIVMRGPYAYVRHPAYAAKNFAWWLGALPMFIALTASSNWKGLAYSVIAVFGWTVIYALRALTEERHLLMGNNGYAQYMSRVRWRFVPGVW